MHSDPSPSLFDRVGATSQALRKQLEACEEGGAWRWALAMMGTQEHRLGPSHP